MHLHYEQEVPRKRNKHGAKPEETATAAQNRVDSMYTFAIDITAGGDSENEVVEETDENDDNGENGENEPPIPSEHEEVTGNDENNGNRTPVPSDSEEDGEYEDLVLSRDFATIAAVIRSPQPAPVP